jgi:hypothetical protein
MYARDLCKNKRHRYIGCGGVSGIWDLGFDLLPYTVWVYIPCGAVVET